MKYYVLGNKENESTLRVKYYSDNRVKKIDSIKFQYDEKKRLLPGDINTKFYYDDKGNIISDYLTLEYSESYGVMNKIGSNNNVVAHINYKRVNVNRSVVDEVKRQQWMIVNAMFNNGYYYYY